VQFQYQNIYTSPNRRDRKRVGGVRGGVGGGMDIFWNYTFIQSTIELNVDMMVSRFPLLEGTEGFRSQGKRNKPIAILYIICKGNVYIVHKMSLLILESTCNQAQ